jgi:hypothetical protein
MPVEALNRILYTAEAVTEGGRAGHGRTSDGRLDAPTVGTRGPGRPGRPRHQPEQLFAVGYAACFQSALLEVTQGRKLATAVARTGNAFKIELANRVIVAILRQLHTGPGRVIGIPVDRLDGSAKTTGAARYSAEYHYPDVAHAALVHATISRGRITTIDLAEALAHPG